MNNPTPEQLEAALLHGINIGNKKKSRALVRAMNILYKDDDTLTDCAVAARILAIEVRRLKEKNQRSQEVLEDILTKARRLQEAKDTGYEEMESFVDHVIWMISETTKP